MPRIRFIKFSFSLFTYFLILSSPSNIHASSLNQKIELKIKSVVERVLGQDWVDKIWGREELEMPDIPKVTEKSTDIKGYERKKIELKKVEGLNPDLKSKLDSAFVQELIPAVLQRQVSGHELSIWLNALAQGGAREGVYRGIALGEEYLQKEESSINSSKFSKDFTRDIMEIYLARTPDAKFLDNIGFYSLKRIVVEKFLEIMDAFENEDDLLKWYAHLSSDLAERFPGLYKSPLRSSVDILEHYHWSQKVNFEFIQSEILIKLHLAYNYIENL